MWCWCLSRDDDEAKPILPKLNVVCFACHRSCCTAHLYQRGNNTIGMCDACFYDLSHFEL